VADQRRDNDSLLNQAAILQWAAVAMSICDCDLVSVRRTAVPLPSEAGTQPLAPQPDERQSETRYHVGTLRGGQSLHNVGNIVVIGDVNPGTEIVASGDIVVFGRLLGVAHAGAQGDASARVYALHLDATQLRIASCIAANEGPHKVAPEPEVAMVADGKIIIVPLEKAGEVLARNERS